ncbi:MAG: T9SS C-terminal target domain-containing protein [Ignavibacteriae bacterium]|nr:MAG: T9SS C-terminal target domain-containing protein [Ignavibacteriota bacterium]
MKTTLLVLLIFLSTPLINSQPNDAANFMPLQIGNAWTYSFYFNSSMNGKHKFTVIDTVSFNNIKYYKIVKTGTAALDVCANPWKWGNLSPIYLRNDTLGRLMQYIGSNACSYTPGEFLIDSLSSKLNDSSKVECLYPAKCNDTSSYTIFGNARRRRSFYFVYSEYAAGGTFVYGIGKVTIGRYTALGSCTNSLLGCVINGILYGDTSLVTGINKISTEVPSSYKLYQNYPNPFNPSTKIKYDVPQEITSQKSDVRLIVYDVIGKEIAVLVNEQLNPGTYEVEWNANHLPSGVYYCKLTAGEHADTKKMLLIR